MNLKKLHLIIANVFLFCVVPALSKPPIFKTDILNVPPPRIIRVCCVLGSHMSLVGIPFAKVDQVTSLEEIGSHQYLSNGKEGNGVIYTRRSGFIDMAHMRDVADWTAYLYSLILTCKEKGITEYQLGQEAGTKILELKLPQDIDSTDEIRLAGRVAYDLSIWHEITTGYGFSTVPLVSERYSSFSIEDAYSNLLGVTLAMKALKSELPYDEAMTQMIANTLDSLSVAKTKDETYAALEDVRNIWWTRDARLPSNKVTLKRQLQTYPSIRPIMLSQSLVSNELPVELSVPMKTSKGQPLDDIYKLHITLNKRFFKKVKKNVTQEDFNYLINNLAKSL